MERNGIFDCIVFSMDSILIIGARPLGSPGLQHGFNFLESVVEP